MLWSYAEGALPQKGDDLVFPDKIKLYDMVRCIAEALDLISPLLAGHHKKVSYIAAAVAEEYGLTPEEQEHVILAGLLHDVGALTLQSKIDTLEFEVKDPSHQEIGYRLLAQCPFLFRAATFVRHHHAWWEREKDAPLESHILHLADRVDVLIDRRKVVL